MRVGDTVTVTGRNWMASDADTTVGFVDAGGAATSTAVTASVDASGQVTAALVATNNDIDATSIVVNDVTSGDPATHRIAIPITVKPQVGVTGHVTAHAHVSPQGAQVEAQPKVWVEAPAQGEALPIPDPAKDAVTQLCDTLAQGITDAGGDPFALTTVCGSIVDGGGGQNLQLLLETPSLLCIAAAPAAQNDPRFIEVCNQVAGGAQPATEQAGTALLPLTDAIP